MIAKDRIAAEHTDSGRLAKAGADAESQMAFYLRRAFGDDPAIHVINDLRVPVPDADGDFAQVDHLVIHRFGLVVIESKSVHDTIVVTEDGEWKRKHRGETSGIRSPVVQARMQADVLRRVLAARFDPLGSGVIGRVPFNVLVAISDRGIIERGSAVAPEVCKADIVPERVRATIAAAAPGGKLFDGVARRQIAEHLISLHTPSRRGRPHGPHAATHSAAGPEARPAAPAALPRPVCKMCGSGALHAQHGRYGYYFRCLTCTRNTPIAKGCPACGEMDVRVRKERLNFFKECRACGRTTLIYVNASLKDLEGPDDDR